MATRSTLSTHCDHTSRLYASERTRPLSASLKRAQIGMKHEFLVVMIAGDTVSRNSRSETRPPKGSRKMSTHLSVLVGLASKYCATGSSNSGLALPSGRMASVSQAVLSPVWPSRATTEILAVN